MRSILIGGITVDRFTVISKNFLLTECLSTNRSCSGELLAEECLGGKCIDDVTGAVCVCEDSFEASSCQNGTEMNSLY